MTREGGGGLEVLDGLHLARVRETDLPPGEGWLSLREREVLAGLKLPKRRSDWLLGRWAAKRAVGSLLGVPLDAVGAPGLEILAAEDGSPRVRVGLPGPAPAPLRLSISHAGGVGFAAASPGTTPVGCDVEVLAPRSEAFVSDYLTERESAAVRGVAPEHAALAANLIWSAKESALKALGEGLRLDTRRVEVDVSGWTRGESPGPVGGDGDWRPLGASGPHGTRFRGSWRVRGGLVWTVLT